MGLPPAHKQPILSLLVRYSMALWAILTCISHAESWSYLARCRLVRRENVGNSNMASPMPNPGRTCPGAGWSVGKMWAIRTWHRLCRILVILGQVRLGSRENV